MYETDKSFNRDEFGNLIPKKVKLLDKDNNETDTELYIIPLVRGQILRYSSGFDYDNNYNILNDVWLISNCIKHPRFTDKEIDIMKQSSIGCLINTIFYYSSIDIKKKSKKKKNKIVEEDEFGKKLNELKQQNKENKLYYFLNERGYSLVHPHNNINKLTLYEINLLIEEFNNLQPKTNNNKTTTK